MKKHLLLSLLVAIPGLTLAQSASLPANPPLLSAPHQTSYDPQVYDVTRNGTVMKLYYTNGAEMKARLERTTEKTRLTAEQYQAEQLKVAGGELALSWVRPVAKRASGEHFTVIISAADGREIYRLKLPATDCVPWMENGKEGCLSGFSLPQATPLADGTRVTILEDHPSKQFERRFEYIIHP